MEAGKRVINGFYAADAAREKFYYVSPELEFLFPAASAKDFDAGVYKSYIQPSELEILEKGPFSSKWKGGVFSYSLMVDYDNIFKAAEKVFSPENAKDLVFVTLTLESEGKETKAAQAAVSEDQSIYFADGGSSLLFRGDAPLPALEKKLKKLTGINKTGLAVDAASDAMFFLRDGFNIHYANDFFASLLKTPAAGIKEKPLNKLVHKLDVLFLEIIKIIETCKSLQLSLFMHTAQKWLLLTAFSAGGLKVVILTDAEKNGSGGETYQKQLKDLASYISDVREEERQKAGKEIHDGLGAILTGVKFDITLMKDAVKSVPPDKDYLNERLGHIDTLTTSAMEEARRISKELSPVALENLGLIDALKWLAEDFEENSKIKCSFKTNITKLDAGKRTSRTLFRILQESLTNVRRHSKASKADIKVTVKNGTVYLEIKDNGIGIDLKKVSASLGLLGMKERIVSLNGTFSISGEKNKGTIVKCSIPLKEEKEN